MTSPIRINQKASEFRARAEELASLLDAAVPVIARQIQVALAPKDRTDEESQFLFDCCRGRREASKETVAKLMLLDARANTYALADTMRALTVRFAPPPPALSLLDVAADYERADVALDEARVLYAHEPTPIRAAGMWEAAKQVVRNAVRVCDLAARQMHLNTRRTA